MSSAQQKRVILAISDKKAVKIFDRVVVNILRVYLPVQLLSPPRACTDWAEEQQKHLSLPTGLFTALTSRPRLLIGRDVEPRLLIGRRKNRFWQRRRGRPRPCCSLTADSVLKCQRGSGSGLLTYGGASQYNEGLLRVRLLIYYRPSEYSVLESFPVWREKSLMIVRLVVVKTSLKWPLLTSLQGNPLVRRHFSGHVQLLHCKSCPCFLCTLASRPQILRGD